MQLMLFNSLLMFDIVFIFFLFLVGVTCVLYYLPPSVRKGSNKRMRNGTSSINNNNDKNNGDLENYKTYTYSSQCRRNTYTNELVEQQENCEYPSTSRTDANDLSNFLNDNSRNQNNQNITSSYNNNMYKSRNFNNNKNNSNDNENSDATVVRINENFMRHTCNCNRSLSNINNCGGGGGGGITLMQIKPNEPQLIEVEIERTNSLSCYVKAKDFDIRDCNGPVFDV